MLGHDALHDPQSQARSFLCLGGKEGLEDSPLNLLGNAGAGVGDGKPDSILSYAGFSPAVLSRATPGSRGTHGNRDPPPFGHSLGGIQEKIVDDLAELVGDAEDRALAAHFRPDHNSIAKELVAEYLQ